MSASSPESVTSPEVRPIISRVFISRDESRLRSGWRILLHLLFASLLTLAAELLFLLSASRLPAFIAAFLNPLPSLAGITFATIIARRFLDKRTFSSIGLQWNSHSLFDLFFGVFLSAALVGCIFFVEWKIGWIRVTGLAVDHLSALQVIVSVINAAWLYIAVGFSEELLSRGYQLQNLRDGTSTRVGVLISSFIFALLHAFNPHASLLSTSGILLAALLLAYGWVRTKQLWLSIGFHIGWNFFQGTVFGFPVSGVAGFHLVEQVDTGASSFSGGAFGPEAGLLVIPIFILGALTIYRYTHSRV